MPHHDYICPDCGNRDEVYVRMSDEIPASATCTRCGRDESRKVYDAEGTCKVNKLREGWSDGYEIFQLPKNCPDRVVTSRTQYDRTMNKYGLDHKTGAPIPGKEHLSSATRFRGKSKKKLL